MVWQPKCWNCGATEHTGILQILRRIEGGRSSIVFYCYAADACRERQAEATKEAR